MSAVETDANWRQWNAFRWKKGGNYFFPWPFDLAFHIHYWVDRDFLFRSSLFTVDSFASKIYYHWSRFWYFDHVLALRGKGCRRPYFSRYFCLLNCWTAKHFSIIFIFIISLWSQFVWWNTFKHGGGSIHSIFLRTTGSNLILSESMKSLFHYA